MYRSTDKGASYTQTINVNVGYNGGSPGNCFYKYKNYWYIMFPGYGILKTTDFVNFKPVWANNYSLYIFMDHNGVILATDLGQNYAYYFRSAP